ncbi:enoyl-CoA hydratase/isomerase family protein [Mycolicibacterium sp. 3033]|nr:enoyl-CoA hydratase/isomerase family protein [Mycolicibacterium aurantiacum]
MTHCLLRDGVLVEAANAEEATFTLTEAISTDRRTVTVASVDDELRSLSQRVERWPIASAVCDDVLRTLDPTASTFGGLVTESLAYSTLQAGPEFARWRSERGPARLTESTAPVLADRDGGVLRVSFNQPDRHNAFSAATRDALLEVLEVARVDDSITEVVLSGRGPSFCSGGDLAEFGSFDDVASAHLVRTRHSPASMLDEITARLGPMCRAEVHGHVLGSGVEMAAFCGHVRCTGDSEFGLPELALGLIPGAGGTVSVTRRIGRWRTAYLVLSGRTIDAETALEWGLIDAVA